MTKNELLDIIETLIELQNAAHEKQDYIVAIEYQFELVKFTYTFEMHFSDDS